MSGLTLSPAERDLFRIVAAVRQLMEGRSNAVGTFTLATAATATTVSAPTCAATSIVLLMPKTANAAAALATTFVTPAKAAFVVTHLSAATTDRTFGFVALG